MSSMNKYSLLMKLYCLSGHVSILILLCSAFAAIPSVIKDYFIKLSS